MAHEIVAVSHAGDVYQARVTARTMAAQIGFDSNVAEEIVLVASELATNLMRHAGGGNLIFQSVSEKGRGGMQIEAHDDGPGIECVQGVFADGYSTAAGLGYGFGTINRLMDELEISPVSGERGLHVTCRRWIRDFDRVRHSFDIGVASRPHPLMTVNGDSFVVKQWDRKALVAVIDGLGHGQAAHRAAETARQYVETHFDSSLPSIFLGVSRACVATRGVVMAAARFDERQNTLEHASLGNVEARILTTTQPVTLVISRGILGYTTRMPSINKHSWDPDSVFVLHSDGLTSRWSWNDFDFGDETPSRIAQELLLKLARKEDDATVVVVKRASE